jgi:hypothetical protein
VWGDAPGNGSVAAYGVYGTNGSATGYAGYFNNSNGGYAAAFMGGKVGIGTATPAALLAVGTTSQFTVDSSGNVYIGQTTNPATSRLVLQVQTGAANGINSQSTSDTGTSYPFSVYNHAGTYVDGLSNTSSGTSFLTSSDKRLKENVHKVFPSAVNVGDDGAADGKGKVKRQWAIDYSKLVPVTVAELKALRARLAADEATIAAMKTKQGM